jgi:hypothetical protein
MGNKRILCSLDAHSQGATFSPSKGSTEDENILWVHANEGMELDSVVIAEHDTADDGAGLFDKPGGRNGGFETLK